MQVRFNADAARALPFCTPACDCSSSLSFNSPFLSFRRRLSIVRDPNTFALTNYANLFERFLPAWSRDNDFWLDVSKSFAPKSFVYKLETIPVDLFVDTLLVKNGTPCAGAEELLLDIASRRCTPDGKRVIMKVEFIGRFDSSVADAVCWSLKRDGVCVVKTEALHCRDLIDEFVRMAFECRH